MTASVRRVDRYRGACVMVSGGETGPSFVAVIRDSLTGLTHQDDTVRPVIHPTVQAMDSDTLWWDCAPLSPLPLPDCAIPR